MTSSRHLIDGPLVHSMGFRPSFDGTMGAISFLPYLVQTFEGVIFHLQYGAAKYAIVLGIYELNMFF